MCKKVLRVTFKFILTKLEISSGDSQLYSTLSGKISHELLYQWVPLLWTWSPQSKVPVVQLLWREQSSAIYIEKGVNRFLLCLQTSESSSVWRIHGNHRIRDAGWTTDSHVVKGTHPKDIRTPLHQPCNREPGVLDWGIITLSPVMGAHFTPSNTKHQHICMSVVEIAFSKK